MFRGANLYLWLHCQLPLMNVANNFFGVSSVEPTIQSRLFKKKTNGGLIVALSTQIVGAQQNLLQVMAKFTK